MKMPKRIEIVSHTSGPNKWSLRIDGEEFPWAVADVQLSPDPNDWPAITLRLPAETVTSMHTVEAGDA